MNFYPRPPRGGRPEAGRMLGASDGISIHALREEGDTATTSPRGSQSYFYPRPPRGGRLIKHRADSIKELFLSTPSARRATDAELDEMAWELFLSTPSARRATSPAPGMSCTQHNFYPRPPRGGRLHVCSSLCVSLHFYPRPPRGGRPRGVRPASKGSDFYPRPPRGGRRLLYDYYTLADLFLSTPSARRATSRLPRARHLQAISIHALREEGDSKNRDKSSIFKQIIQHSARI